MNFVTHGHPVASGYGKFFYVEAGCYGNPSGILSHEDKAIRGLVNIAGVTTGIRDAHQKVQHKSGIRGNTLFPELLLLSFGLSANFSTESLIWEQGVAKRGDTDGRFAASDLLWRRTKRVKFPINIHGGKFVENVGPETWRGYLGHELLNDEPWSEFCPQRREMPISLQFSPNCRFQPIAT